MRTMSFATIAIAGMMLTTAGAGAAVNVTFSNPQTWRDDDFRSASKRQGVIEEFTRYFERLDKRYLKKEQKLDIEVLDARLAGRYERWQPEFSDVRILRDTTPPRFVIRYKLRQDGKVIASGEEVVSNLNYLWSSSARNSIERFAYEKEMLRDWFRKRFVQMQPPRG